VARHLDALERRVGTRLFARTSRGVEITPAGAEVIEALDRVAGDLDHVERSLRARGPGLKGPVAQAAPSGLIGELVLPALGELYRQHPDLELSVITGPALEVLQRGQSDMALWLTDDPPEDLIGRPLGTIMACAYAAPACLQRVESAARTRWIGSADPASLSARVRVRHFPGLVLGLRLDDVALRATALEAGLGVGLLPCHVGDSRPGLTRVGSMEPVRQGEIWLFTRPESRGVARIQAVSSFLQQLFGRQRLSLEGKAAEGAQAS
jgi:DNA-binding transcriptional LysR family regulator